MDQIYGADPFPCPSTWGGGFIGSANFLPHSLNLSRRKLCVMIVLCPEGKWRYTCRTIALNGRTYTNYNNLCARGG